MTKLDAVGWLLTAATIALMWYSIQRPKHDIVVIPLMAAAMCGVAGIGAMGGSYVMAAFLLALAGVFMWQWRAVLKRYRVGGE